MLLNFLHLLPNLHPEGGSPTRGKHHLLCGQYPDGYGGERYSHVRAEGKHHPGGYDPLDQVGRAEPSNCEDGSGAVYTPSSIQSPTFCLKGEQIRPCTALRYLGLWFDGKLSFKKHAKQTVTKAKRIVASISWLMSNLGGPSEGKVSF